MYGLNEIRDLQKRLAQAEYRLAKLSTRAAETAPLIGMCSDRSLEPLANETLAAFGGEANAVRMRGDGKPSLLSLPPELRNRIYEFVVTEAQPITVHGIAARKDKKKIYWEVRGDKRPALARVCKVLRDDVLSSYYRLNAFKLQHLGEDADAEHEAAKDAVWARLGGHHLSYLSSLEIQIGHHVRLSPTSSARKFMPYTVRAKILRGGTLVLNCESDRWSYAIRTRNVKFCACEAHRRSVQTVAKGKVCKRLLELARSYALFSSSDANQGICKRCNLPNLEICDDLDE